MSRMDARAACYIDMFSGAIFHPLDPSPEEILVEDIILGLANTSRYNGGTSDFYSTAQHCVIMSYIAEEDYGLEMARAALLHEVGEVYCGEIVKPVKDQIPDFERIECPITRIAFEKFGLDPDLWNCEAIRKLDMLMVAIEYRDLRENCDLHKMGCAHYPDPDPEIIIDPLSPKRAWVAFWKRFAELFPEFQDQMPDFAQ